MAKECVFDDNYGPEVSSGMNHVAWRFEKLKVIVVSLITGHLLVGSLM